MAFELRNKAIEIMLGNPFPTSFAGQMPDDLKGLFIAMADEIGCLKARVDELEKKMAKIHPKNNE